MIDQMSGRRKPPTSTGTLRVSRSAAPARNRKGP